MSTLTDTARQALIDQEKRLKLENEASLRELEIEVQRTRNILRPPQIDPSMTPSQIGSELESYNDRVLRYVTSVLRGQMISIQQCNDNVQRISAHANQAWNATQVTIEAFGRVMKDLAEYFAHLGFEAVPIPGNEEELTRLFEEAKNVLLQKAKAEKIPVDKARTDMLDTAVRQYGPEFAVEILRDNRGAKE